MSRLTSELTVNQIDDWFKIGKSVPKVKTVSRSKTTGRDFDATTGQARVSTDKTFIPSYRRPTGLSRTDYAAAYQQKESQQLIHSINPLQAEDGAVVSQLDQMELESMVSGSVGVPEALLPPNATDVYNNYSFEHEYSTTLPITCCQEQVVSTIESNQVTIIHGATGSGKTTQVPQYILDHYANEGRYCNIVVTQPRRIAAISIARRVCHERNWTLGTICGYKVGLDKETSSDTRISYVTTGVLLNILINKKNMHDYTHVILDEVHERDQNSDFCLLVVRKFLRTNSKHVKVVLMSATASTVLFADYFALPIRGQLERAPVVSVEGKPFNVSEYYTEHLRSLVEALDQNESDPRVSPEAEALSIRLVQEFDKLEVKEQGLVTNGFATRRGTVLIFLPGLMEIDNLFLKLKEIEVFHRLKIIPLHSSITTAEQSLVFELPEPGERKVILSTNIAESSITVPDIKYVIDFCLTKSLICDTDTNYTSLQLQWASKSSCTQRKGRAGRVSSGRVYRMVTKRFYDNYLPEYDVPEMQRCPLGNLILRVKVLDLGEPKAILALALAPPNLDDIERTILLLREVGALSTPSTRVVNRHDGELTFIGRVLAAMPVDIRIGKMLVMGHVFGFLEECLIIGAALSLKSIFARPFKSYLEAYKLKSSWSGGSLSDCVAILNVYKVWNRNNNLGLFRRRGESEKSWGEKNFVQIRRLKEVAQLVKELEDRLNKFNIHKPRNTPHYKGDDNDPREKLLLKLVMCSAFYPNYFEKGPMDEQDALKSMSGMNPLNTVMVKGLPADQGTLYKHSIEQLFKCCHNKFNVHFEATRCYIEFTHTPGDANMKVHPAVYRAVKLRELRIPLEVQLYSRDQAREMMDRLQGHKDQEANQNNWLRTNRFVAANRDSGYKVGRQVAPPEAARSTILIMVTHVLECGHFWGQYAEDQSFIDLEKVQSTLNQSGGRDLEPITGPIHVGMHVAALFQDQSREYYRAVIHEVERKHNANHPGTHQIVLVFYLDYGNTQKVDRQDLRLMPPALVDIPFQAVEFCLHGIRPSALRCPDGNWTLQANNEFRHMVSNKELLAQVYSIVDGVLRVNLVERTTNHGREMHIDHLLVNKGYADVAEESLMSKQSNKQRTEEAMMEASSLSMRNWSDKPVSEPPGTAKSEWREIQLDAKTAGKRTGGRVRLNGPHNPYEMSFFSMTTLGRLRTTRIEQDSVNSVSIDDEPQDPHARMMVAGYVGLNPSGTILMARETTIMPLIPGLPALVSLLFTPVAEFRCDSKRIQYTGAICGLGYDAESGGPMLPDHDMEITFDCKLDSEDIAMINSVRIAINMAVGSNDEVCNWNADAMIKLQEKARTKLLELIQRRRETVEPRHYDRAYSWNQLSGEEILPHSIQTGDSLYSFHNGIALVNDEADISKNERHQNYLVKHVRWLHEVAERLDHREAVLCELCRKTCSNPHFLLIHMQTNTHIQNEEELLRTHDKIMAGKSNARTA